MDTPKPWIVTLVVALAACVPFYPPAGAIRIDPPPRFERLYTDMERCLGKDGDFAKVKWWMVPGYAFRRDAWIYEALWSPGHNITLLGFDAGSHADSLVLRCTGPLQSSLITQAR